MSVFPSAKHLASWAGCCPRNDQSNKKVKSTRISRAGCYLKPLLVQIANAVIKSDRHPECRERYRRIKARRGHKKAIIAACRMLLTAIWNVLSKLEPYSAKGYLADKLTEHSVVISKAEGPGSTSQAGLYFQGRTGRRVRLRPSSISFFPAVPAAVFLRPFSFCFGYRFVSNLRLLICLCLYYTEHFLFEQTLFLWIHCAVIAIALLA